MTLTEFINLLQIYKIERDNDIQAKEDPLAFNDAVEEFVEHGCSCRFRKLVNKQEKKIKKLLDGNKSLTKEEMLILLRKIESETL